MTCIALHRLGHYAPEKRFEADASDLGFGPGKEPFTLFPAIPGAPAAPGVEVRNRRTGNVVKFILRDRERNADGDIMTWRFVPHPDTLAKFPGLAGYTLVVFNT